MQSEHEEIYFGKTSSQLLDDHVDEEILLVYTHPTLLVVIDQQLLSVCFD